MAGLPLPVHERVRDCIRTLTDDPRPAGCLKLTGRNGRRIRVGDHWVIYEIDDSTHSVLILHVGHRRDVYSR